MVPAECRVCDSVEKTLNPSSVAMNVRFTGCSLTYERISWRQLMDGRITGMLEQLQGLPALIME
jgi:hypothetical protein